MKKYIEQLRANPLYKKYELFVPPIVCVVIVVALIFAVVVPNVFQYFETSKKITEAEDKLTFFNEKESLLKSVNKESFTEGINRSLVILPTDKEAPTAIAQLYYILGLTNMTVENIAFSDAGAAADGKSFKIALEVKGSLSSLTNFILQLKDAPRIMRINTLEISGAGGTGDILSTIMIDAFYEPLPASISSIDQPVNQPSKKELEALDSLANSAFPNIGSDKDYSGPKGKPNPFE